MVPKSLQVHGYTLFLDPQDSLNLAINGAYEPYETSLVSRLVGPGDVVVDVGANIGYYTLLFAQLVGGTGRVLAFEPVPSLCKLVRMGVKANEFVQVEVYEQALSDAEETSFIYLDPFGWGDNRPYRGQQDRIQVEMQAVPFDDVHSSERGVDFIKMDVQGGEGAALRGMNKLLTNTPRLKLCIEFWPHGLEGAGDDPRILLEGLLGYGFSLFEICENSSEIRATTADELLKAYTAKNNLHTNLLCTKGCAPEDYGISVSGRA